MAADWDEATDEGAALRKQVAEIEGASTEQRPRSSDAKRTSCEDGPGARTLGHSVDQRGRNERHVVSGHGLGRQGSQGETLRIKIDGTAVARSEGGQIIGRSSADAKYVIAVDTVSRHHARLRVDGSELTIKYLGSMNGTTLDGEKLVKGQPRTVRRGARIGLGDVEFDTQFLKEQD